MKKLYMILIIMCGPVLASYATVRTVCNMTYSPGQFTTFAAALTASAVNDTIYVHGSSISYGAITVNRAGLVVIGAGHNPAKTVPLTSMFSLITVSAAGCQFIGLTLDEFLVSSPSATVTIRRCKLQISNSTFGISFNASGSGDNAVIEGNVFSGVNFAGVLFNGFTASNTVIRNNIFNCSTAFAIGNDSGSTTNLQIINNLFLGSNSNTLVLNNALINNNVFYRSSPQGSFTGCAMNNNISFQCVNNNFGAAGSNNLVGVNPLFTSFPGGGALFDYSHDYHLAAGSPGQANGTDGTDRGVYGGFGAKFNMSGEPAIAEVTNFTITSPTTISPGGTLTISVTSKRVN